ncbi:hypothetical protein F0562_016004 [Nyssa sinensis]|uniref:Uncharacterized protein n=1 Tax=Nyssa sinensis TaxID=561372 RepID=A0A5J4ZIN8_9ASTE|nr:hypothetical protein F0562_016004 [Nyssa sinensis]
MGELELSLAFSPDIDILAASLRRFSRAFTPSCCALWPSSSAVCHCVLYLHRRRFTDLNSPIFIDVDFTPGIRMKLKVVWRKVYDYVRYDLKEIAFPSSLPDPPHIKKRRKLTWKERYHVLEKASRLYAASWVRDIGPDLRPNDYKKNEESKDEPNGVNGTTKERDPSTLEDLAVAARGGMETLRPALQRVYMTRASAYRDALKSFIEGYQEVIDACSQGARGSEEDKVDPVGRQKAKCLIRGKAKWDEEILTWFFFVYTEA